MFEQILDNVTGKSSDATIKARNILAQTPRGTTINISDLARQTGAQRKTLTNLINREFPNQFNLLGRSEASKQVQQKLKEKRAATAVTKPTLVSEGRKFVDVRFPNEEMRKEYLNDLQKKKSAPKSSSKEFSNKALAKKYFGDEKKAFQIERMNQVLSKQKGLEYVKGKPSQSYITRQSRKKESQKYLSDFEKGILKRQEVQKRTLNNYFKNNSGQLYKNKDLKNLVDAKLVDGKIDLSPRYKTEAEYKNLAKSGKLFDEYDISPIRGEKRSIQYPVNKNISPGKFNQGFIRQVESYFEKTKGDTSPKVVQNKKQINNFLKKYGYRLEIPGEGYIGAKSLPAINRKTEALPNIKNTLNKIGLGNLSQSKQTFRAQGLGPIFVAELPLYTMAEGKPFVETLDPLTFGAVNPVTYAAKKQAGLSDAEKLAMQREKNLNLLRTGIGNTSRQEMLGMKDPEYRALGSGKPSYLDFLIQKMEQPDYVGSLTSGQQKIEDKAQELRQKIMTPEKTEAAKTRYESFQKAFPIVPLVTNFLESMITGEKVNPYQKTLEQIQGPTYQENQIYKKGGIVALDEYKELRKKYGP